ncbi:hypothetical protein DFP72DRAFT_461293 [Ephemerocybe angulata]|uniref:Uncharacterized protein n=1 Tax=Ephemerocybe angulata TaxID=980116 RepID=A0A8H6M5A6_9AGAR|nr:hypothetical protein DFP72DRAFT_461293 [Tulosesus angulatus]
MSHYQSQFPPPLCHLVLPHPAYIPEPPSTPSSPQGSNNSARSNKASRSTLKASRRGPWTVSSRGMPYIVSAYAAAFQGSYGRDLGAIRRGVTSVAQLGRTKFRTTYVHHTSYSSISLVSGLSFPARRSNTTSGRFFFASISINTPASAWLGLGFGAFRGLFKIRRPRVFTLWSAVAIGQNSVRRGA